MFLEMAPHCSGADALSSHFMRVWWCRDLAEPERGAPKYSSWIRQLPASLDTADEVLQMQEPQRMLSPMA